MYTSLDITIQLFRSYMYVYSITTFNKEKNYVVCKERSAHNSIIFLDIFLSTTFWHTLYNTNIQHSIKTNTCNTKFQYCQYSSPQSLKTNSLKIKKNPKTSRHGWNSLFPYKLYFIFLSYLVYSISIGLRFRSSAHPRVSIAI